MLIDCAQVHDSFWHVDAAGHVHENNGPMPAALTGGVRFLVCELAQDRSVAVFLDREVSPSLRAQLLVNRPDWMQGIVYACLKSGAEDSEVRIATELGFASGIDAAVCAFATCCVAANMGVLLVAPERYIVQILDSSSFEVSMEFDDDTECWYGEALELGA